LFRRVPISPLFPYTTLFRSRFIEVDSDWSNWFLIKLAIPSNSILYSLVIPMISDLTENFSLPPLRIICIASSGIFSIGSDSLKSYFVPMVSNCLKIQEFLYSPSGANPPFFIESFGFGITFLRLISFTTPNPLQCGQAPLGELNEKLFGSGFG